MGWAEKLRAGTKRRSWPITVGALVVVTGMAFSLAWEPLVSGRNVILTPGDIWPTIRGAFYVGSGALGDVYLGHTGLLTFPGIAVVFAPIALIVVHFNLSQNIPLVLARPTAWYLVGPFEIAAAIPTLIALDALAERLGITEARRRLVVVVEAVAIWPVVVMWGHPEDLLCLACIVWALLASMSRRRIAVVSWTAAAIALQPLALLAVPALVATIPQWRFRFISLIEMLAPSAVLLGVPLLSRFHATWVTVTQQPTYPSVDHPTPWLPLAPVLVAAHWVIGNHVYLSHGLFHSFRVRKWIGPTVAGGPIRLVPLAGGLAIGYVIWRRRPPLDALAWWIMLALALRPLTEAVMTPYYLWPPLAFGVVLAARRSPRALVCSVGLVVFDTIYPQWHLEMWIWWVPTMLALVGTLWVARPAMLLGESRAFHAAHQIDEAADSPTGVLIPS